MAFVIDLLCFLLVPLLCWRLVRGAVPMAVLIANVFYHFRLGLQVVIEDYQHNETRVVLMVLLNVYTLGLGAAAIFSVLRLAFTGAPR